MSRIFRFFCILLITALVFPLICSVPVQAAAALTLSASTGSVGDTITITGTGFESGEYVTVAFSGNSTNDFEIQAGTTGSASGRFSRTFTIPSSPAGDHLISATGDTSFDEVLFSVTPKITLSKTSGDPGSSLTVSGYGFGYNESGITITFGGSEIGSPKSASTYGYWTNTITVPTVTAGSYTITATGNSNYSASASFTVNLNAKIKVDKSSGPHGTTVKVDGSGFSSGESGITVTFGTKPIGVSTSASSTGTWTITFTTPPMPGGTYYIDAYGSTTSASSVSDLAFSVTTTVIINPTSGAPGGSITIEGSGFRASETVTVSYDTTDLSPTYKADSEGSWSGTFTVPAGSSGIHKIYARGTSTAKTTGLDFKVGSGLSIDKNSGVIGSVINLTGSGFAAKETGINIIFDGGTKIATSATASDTGSWTATYTIPAVAGGVHKIGAEGKTTKNTTVPEVEFTVLPDISIDKTEGVAGDVVNIAGNGFMANETGILITYDGKAVGAKISADAKGSWKAAVNIPPSAAGDHTIAVSATLSKSVTLPDFSYVVTPSMSINPSEGFIGTSVSITGTGFAPNSNLRFIFDGVDINVGVTTTDAFGNFNKSMVIPKAQGGSHIIRVQDNRGNNMEAVFDLDAVAPSSPKLNSPADGIKIGMFGNITPTLEWQKVTDQSGVTYNLQVARDSDFSDLVIEITGSTSTKYAIKTGEALPRGTYYWRIQAVDGAGNSSDWTEPRLMVSGKISPAIFALIIVAVVAALAVGGFFLLRFLRKRQKASQPQTAPEIVIPEVVNAEFKQIEGEKKALPFRLALPQAPQPARGSKSAFSEEDQARLKVIIDFAKSVPLAEPGANTNWLVDLAENNTGLCASPTLYSQLVRGELQLHYEPAWMRHPTYMDLLTLLEGQPLLQDLNSFIDSVNRTAADAEAVLGEIYQEILSEVQWDIFASGGWSFISAVYMDSFNWFQGKYLKEPAEKDYSIKAETIAVGGDGFGLYAEAHTPFSGLLIQLGEEKDAQNLRTLHIKLRRDFRNNERIKQVVTSVIQLEVQRNRLVNAFKQFSRLNP